MAGKGYPMGKSKPMAKGKKPAMEVSVSVVKTNPRKSKKY